MADVLAKQPRPRGPRLTILTNAGGPGVIAADALIGGGGQLAPLAAETLGALDQILPSHWSHGNPIDKKLERIWSWVERVEARPTMKRL